MKLSSKIFGDVRLSSEYVVLAVSEGETPTPPGGDIISQLSSELHLSNYVLTENLTAFETVDEATGTGERGGVWFSDSETPGKPVQDENFTYNPKDKILTLSVLNSNQIRSQNDSGKLVLRGSASKTRPEIVLHGENSGGNDAGTVQITTKKATTGAKDKTLNLTPDGKMTWDGKNVVRSVAGQCADDAGNVDLSGYMKYDASSPTAPKYGNVGHFVFSGNYLDGRQESFSVNVVSAVILPN